MSGASRACALVAALALACRALAAQQPAQGPRPFEGQADLEFVSTSGNQRVTTIAVGDKLWLRRPAWSLHQYFNLVYGENRGVRNAEIWRAGARGDVNVNPRLAIYALVAFDRNVLAGIESRFEETLGLAWKAFDEKKYRVTVEGGIAAVHQRSTTPGQDRDFYVPRSAVTARYNVTEKGYVQQFVEVLPSLNDSRDVRINAETALVAPFTRWLSLKVSYIVRYDALPEPGFARTDRLLTSGMQLRW